MARRVPKKWRCEGKTLFYQARGFGLEKVTKTSDTSAYVRTNCTALNRRFYFFWRRVQQKHNQGTTRGPDLDRLDKNCQNMLSRSDRVSSAHAIRVSFVT